MRTRNAIANDIVRAFDRLAEKHGANIPMGDLGALIYIVESELDGVRAEALAPSPDTGLPVQTFTDAEIAAIDWALQGESVPLELRGKVIQTIALSGRRWDHAEPAPSLDTGTSTHEHTKEETKT